MFLQILCYSQGYFIFISLIYNTINNGRQMSVEERRCEGAGEEGSSNLMLEHNSWPVNDSLLNGRQTNRRFHQTTFCLPLSVLSLTFHTSSLTDTITVRTVFVIRYYYYCSSLTFFFIYSFHFTSLR